VLEKARNPACDPTASASMLPIASVVDLESDDAAAYES
jgi:hypothetical protein